MFDTVKNLSSWFFTRPSSDFFGPQATKENLICIILQDPSIDHIVLDCNEGIGRTEVIHEMAKQIADSYIRPSWLRHNGSVELEKLRKTVKMTDEVAQSLLTADGFVKLSDLHFFDRESINEWSQDQGKRSQYVSCPTCAHQYQKVTFSPAIALRIQMGKDFNPKACKSAFKESQKVISLKSDYSVLDIPEPVNYLKDIRNATLSEYDSWFWSRAVTAAAVAVLTAGAAYYTGYVPSFSTLANQGF